MWRRNWSERSGFDLSRESDLGTVLFIRLWRHCDGLQANSKIGRSILWLVAQNSLQRPIDDRRYFSSESIHLLTQLAAVYSRDLRSSSNQSLLLSSAPTNRLSYRPTVKYRDLSFEPLSFFRMSCVTLREIRSRTNLFALVSTWIQGSKHLKIWYLLISQRLDSRKIVTKPNKSSASSPLRT
jgi:hypothetical protein